MYQSYSHDPYGTYYYTTMNTNLEDCHSPEFRVRSQTWGGNEIGYRNRVNQLSPSQQYKCCYDSLNSNEGSSTSIQGINSNEHSETVTEGQSKETIKKTSRKNPWGQETYADLIESAINSYPSKMATLQQIYDHISKNYKYFLERSDSAASAGWKNSIRHNLSLHDKFLKCPKKNENMKSSLWSINQNCYKRTRSNSMDCKKSGQELVAKRRLMKEQRRSSASNSNILSDAKRPQSLKSPKSEKVVKFDSFAVPSLSNEEPLREGSPEFMELETDMKYLPPDVAVVHKEDNLHEDLGKLGMNSMEPIYNYDDREFPYDCSQIPNFHTAALEYSKFVAELFLEELE